MNFAAVLILSVMCLSLSSVDCFSSRPATITKFHSTPKSLNVVINNRNRDERKIELPPSGLKSRREPKGSNSLSNKLFGFTTNAELLNGRIAMAFFFFGMYEEITTGKGILQQVGLNNQIDQANGLVFAGLFGCVALYPSIMKLVEKINAIRRSSAGEL